MKQPVKAKLKIPTRSPGEHELFVKKQLNRRLYTVTIPKRHQFPIDPNLRRDQTDRSRVPAIGPRLSMFPRQRILSVGLGLFLSFSERCRVAKVKGFQTVENPLDHRWLGLYFLLPIGPFRYPVFLIHSHLCSKSLRSPWMATNLRSQVVKLEKFTPSWLLEEASKWWCSNLIFLSKTKGAEASELGASYKSDQNFGYQKLDSTAFNTLLDVLPMALTPYKHLSAWEKEPVVQKKKPLVPYFNSKPYRFAWHCVFP